MKTLKDLKRLQLTCMALRLKNYNACLEYDKLYVVYDKIRFKTLKDLKTYVHKKRERKFNTED